MEAALETLVRRRANGRCEYCHFPEAFSELPFQIDHIVPRKHGGETALENLALVCSFCNRYKGPNLAGVDLLSGEITPLFNPRRQNWHEHFCWRGAELVGQTSCGRATVRTLNVNRVDALLVRALLMADGAYPA